MPASMMIEVTGSRPKVTGSRMAMVAARPRPRSTQMSMPMTTPMRQYRRLFGSPTTAKPSSTGDRLSKLCSRGSEHVRDGDVERNDEQQIERDHGGQADHCRRSPGLVAEEPQPDEGEHGGRDHETDHADHGHEDHHRRHGGQHEQT